MVSDELMNDLGIGSVDLLRYIAVAEMARGTGQIVVDWLTDAADELERLRSDCAAMAAVLMGPRVFVHESIVAEVDGLLTRHLGGYMGTAPIA